MQNASTKPSSIARLEEMRAALVFRTGLLSQLRSFFLSKSFIETDTSVIIDAPAPEEYIEAVSASKSSFLRTSPELQMKQLLAAGYENIFQIGPCFREGEYGRNHRPEFTMIEWYIAHADYSDMKNFTVDMIKSAASALLPDSSSVFRGRKINFSGEWHDISVRDAFIKYADVCVEDAIAQNRFEEILVEKVETALPQDKPCFLTDYPACLGALARLKNSDRTLAERWELYIGGVEIANAYSELTDPAEQRERFANSTAFRNSRNMKKYGVPEEFYEAIDYGIPESTGCALGFDRLTMVMSGAEDLSGVIP